MSFRCFASYLLQPVILCLALWVTGCSPSETPEKFYTFNGPTMGTWYNVKIQSLPESLEPNSIKKAIDTVLEDINQKMSTYQADSELSRLNRSPLNTPFDVSAETYQVLEISADVFNQSDGAFDITVGPLVNLWGFGPEFKEDAVPDDNQISELLRDIGAESVQLDSNSSDYSVSKTKPVSIDLSAVAKGFATDQVAEKLESLGIQRYMVEVGGEIRVGRAKLSGEPWKIAIEEPSTLERSIQKVLAITQVAVATSGDYRNFFEVEGKRYSHTIDPRTGRPVDHTLASVTVIHSSCAYADAYATALTVLGPEKGMDLAKKLNLAVYMIVKGEQGFDVLQSEAFSSYVSGDEV